RVEGALRAAQDGGHLRDAQPGEPAFEEDVDEAADEQLAPPQRAGGPAGGGAGGAVAGSAVDGGAVTGGGGGAVQRAHERDATSGQYRKQFASTGIGTVGRADGAPKGVRRCPRPGICPPSRPSTSSRSPA